VYLINRLPTTSLNVGIHIAKIVPKGSLLGYLIVPNVGIPITKMCISWVLIFPYKLHCPVLLVGFLSLSLTVQGTFFYRDLKISFLASHLILQTHLQSLFCSITFTQCLLYQNLVFRSNGLNTYWSILFWVSASSHFPCLCWNSMPRLNYYED